MSNPVREERLKVYGAEATAQIIAAGDALARRQSEGGAHRGNVPPWRGADDLDFHGTLAALWIWSRAQRLSGQDRFALNVAAGWAFIDASWRRFIPPSLGPDASDEAAYDCAMVLRAALGNDALRDSDERRVQVAAAGRLLAAHLSDLDDGDGRDFRDPGFLAWNLAEYARQMNDRGLLATVRRFVDRTIGMKAAPPFAAEAEVDEGLFDFSSTTATRVLAVIAAEGATPFVGAWLRERVAAGAPQAFTPRPMDENCWNACVAVALGRAYVVATDPRFLDGHEEIMGELRRRLQDGSMGRRPGFTDETRATFYYALALDALIKV